MAPTCSNGAVKAVSSARPCAVCTGNHKCSRKDDGLILCGRRKGEVFGFVFLGAAKGDDQFSLYRRADDPTLTENTRLAPSHPAKRNGAAGPVPQEPAIDWNARATELAANLTPEARDSLAEALGIPAGFWPDGLQIGAGQDAGGRFWSFPEKDGASLVAGILRRYEDGSKRAMAGGHRGLIAPDGWDRQNGQEFLFAPEGPSDVLALSAIGLSVIGRPSNTGGAEQLAKLLSSLPEGQRPTVVLLGEFDPKPDGKWPGRDGAAKVAAELQEKLGNGWKIRWALPPNGAKDARKWVNDLGLDSTIADAWAVAGDQFLDGIKDKLQTPPAPEPTQDPNREDRSYRFEPLTSHAFFTSDYHLEWLVKRLLVRGQPGIFGGPKKALKTTILMDLAISLATATSFLGYFSVYRPCRVVMISGESGEAVMQETGRRICAARGIDPTTLNLFWSFRLPQMANVLDRDRLSAGLKDLGADVVIIDPLYLSLLAGMDARGIEAGNLFQMGPLLLDMARACLDVGCTPLLCHHAAGQKIRTRGAEPMELDDLAFAGSQEFARQWVLINRRKLFDPETGSSRLWLSGGGSAGQSGCWGLDIEEGVLADDFTGRKWEVTVTKASATRNDEAEQGDDKKAEQNARQDKSDDARVLNALDRLVKKAEDAASPTKKKGAKAKTQAPPTSTPIRYPIVGDLQVHSALSPARTKRATARLVDDGIIEEVPMKKWAGKNHKVEQPVIGYRRKQTAAFKTRATGENGEKPDSPDSPDSPE